MSDQNDFDARVKIRYEVLAKNAVSWVNSVYTFTDNKVKLSFNPSLIYLVAQSALIDIERYKEHHLLPDEVAGQINKDRLSDEVKRAAYFMKWIRKLQPIHLDASPKDASHEIGVESMRYATLSNIGFAISYALNSLADDPKSPNIIKPSPVFYEELLYVLTYRELQGDGLLMIMHMLRNVAQRIPLLRE